MKLLVVSCLKLHFGHVASLFKQADIDVFRTDIFSTGEINGQQNGMPNLLEDWFNNGGSDVNEMTIFTYVAEQNAEHGIKLIENYNKKVGGDFPVKAFIMSAETSV